LDQLSYALQKTRQQPHNRNFKSDNINTETRVLDLNLSMLAHYINTKTRIFRRSLLTRPRDTTLASQLKLKSAQLRSPKHSRMIYWQL
jgi:hypothetical protein